MIIEKILFKFKSFLKSKQRYYSRADFATRRAKRISKTLTTAQKRDR